MADNHSREVTEDLNRAADALESMQSLAPSSPNVPPAMFRAGGPMSVSFWIG